MWEHGGGGRGEEGEGMEFRVEAVQVPGTFSSVLSCFPRVLLRFRFRQWNRGLVKIVSCPCGFIAAVVSAPLSKVGSLFYLSLQEVDF